MEPQGRVLVRNKALFSFLRKCYSTAIRPQYRFHQYQRFGLFSQRGAFINKEKVWGLQQLLERGL